MRKVEEWRRHLAKVKRNADNIFQDTISRYTKEYQYQTFFSQYQNDFLLNDFCLGFCRQYEADQRLMKKENDDYLAWREKVANDPHWPKVQAA